MKKRIIRNIVISLILLLLMLLYTFMARHKSLLFFDFYNGISQEIINTLAKVTSFVSFSIWEIVCLFLIVLIIADLIKRIKQKQFLLWLSRLILTVCILSHLFVGIWGLNYYQPDLFVRMNLDRSSYDTEQLKELTEYLLEKANYYEKVIDRDENGDISADYDDINRQIFLGYERIGQQYDFLNCIEVNAKKLLSSRYFSLSSTTGIFICLTGESNVSRYVHYTSLPFTIAHEMAHRSCIAREDEANFIAYLVSTATDDAYLNYSAYYEAFIYCSNELYECDREAFETVKIKMSEGFRNDIIKANEHYDKLENRKVNDLSNEFYENYLQAFDIEGGVKTYSEVVQLLLSWYYQNK